MRHRGTFLLPLSAVVIAALCACAGPRWRVQMRVMADMRTISIALEAYARDHQGKYPQVAELVVAANSRHTAPWLWPPSAWPPRDGADVRLLRPALEQQYVEALPINDEWGRPIRCAISADLRSYTLISFGRDGKEDIEHPRTTPRGDLDRDLVLTNETWLCFPDGTSI